MRTFFSKKSQTVGLLCFGLPFGLFLSLLVFFQITPFGEKTLLISDLDSQYIQFLSEYRRILLGNGNFLYNWNTGMGMNFPALIAYYLASPFNFLLVLFQEEELTTAISLLTLLKLSCAGGCFACYLRHRFDPDTTHPALLCAFSVFYALSGYAIGYAFNIMWLDALIWLPLLCLECERLLSNGNWERLCLVFTLSFLSHFYTAYMTGMFCGFYFLGRSFVLSVEKPFKKFFRFGLAVGFAAAFSAFLLLPTYFSLRNNMSLMGQTMPAFETQFFFPDLFSKLFLNTHDGMKDCLPHIYCGLPAAAGFLLYLTRPEIKKKERLLNGLFAAFLCLSFWLHPLDFLWHAMDHPSWFPYRYAFLLTFLLQYCAFESFLTIRKNDQWVWILLGVGAFAFFSHRTRLLALNLGFLAAYALCRPVFQKKWELFLFIFACTESLLNSAHILTLYGPSYTEKPNYEEFTGPYREALKQVPQLKDDFFRIEKKRFHTYNDPMGIGFSGISHFSSTASIRQTEFLKRLGFDCYASWCTHAGATPVSDSFLSIRFILNEDGSVKENPEAFPLMFFAEESLARLDYNSNHKNPLERQNEIMRSLGGKEAFSPLSLRPTTTENLKKTTPQKWERINEDAPAWIEYHVREEKVPVYLYLPTLSLNYDVSIDGEKIFSAGRNFTPYPVLLPNGTDHTKEHTLRIEPMPGQYFLEPVEAYAFDPDALTLTAKNVNDAAPRIIRSGYSSFRLEFEPKDHERLLITSIPFDSGWKIQSGGNSIPQRMIWDALLAVNVPAESSEVELSFWPRGLTEGLIISLAALPLAAAAAYLTRKENYL